MTTLLPLLLDVVVPTAGYFLLHALGFSDVWALTVAQVPKLREIVDAEQAALGRPVS